MGDNSQIEWTDATWNPITGCTKVSQGCKNCYAERVTERFGRGPFSEIKVHPERFDQPFRWKRPRLIFVNSMSDLFHEKLDVAVIKRIFEEMIRAPQHTYQVLTKRPERMAAFLNLWGEWADNPASHIWLGTSVEDQATADLRVPILLEVPAASRFLSCEPLLGPVDLSKWLPNLNWIIGGGESGPGFRETKVEWGRKMRDQCLEAKVPFFWKQWGGLYPKAGGNLLDGRVWDDIPGGWRAAAQEEKKASPPQGEKG